MLTKVDVSSTNAGVPLYPNWVMRSKTKPTGHDAPKCYRVPKEDTYHSLTLDEELDAVSMLDPLQSAFQSSQPDSQHYSTPSSPLGAEGPQMPPHYSDTTAVVPPFDLTQIGILSRMSPVTDQENELLNLAPGSPVRRVAQLGLTQAHSRSERSSYPGSPMSLGSPAGAVSLALALRVRTRPAMPTIYNSRRQQPLTDDMKRWTLPKLTPWTRKTEDREGPLHVHPASAPCLVHRRVGPKEL